MPRPSKGKQRLGLRAEGISMLRPETQASVKLLGETTVPT